jgi:hypothetical protein
MDGHSMLIERCLLVIDAGPVVNQHLSSLVK